MKYYLESLQEKGVVFYSRQLLVHLIKINGHELCEKPEDADFILVSVCDTAEINLIKKMRERFPDKKIIVGGYHATYFKLYAIFADYVNVGQGFEFFECQTEDEIRKLDCIYWDGCEKLIIPSTEIRWEKCPAIQVSKKRFYYWAAVGCKNKCKFCLTSWSNLHQMNPYTKRIKRKMESEGYFLKLIENEEMSNLDVKEPVKDFMLKDYIKTTNISAKLIRLGIEFATEENRKLYGKPFTDDEFLFAIDKAKREKKDLTLFCLGGVDTREEWADFICKIPKDWETKKPNIFFKFTNLEIQQFTPIWRKRYDLINPENRIDKDDLEWIWDRTEHAITRLRFRPVKYPAHSLWRTGLNNVFTREEFDFWWSLKNEKDKWVMHDHLIKSNVLENDYKDSIKISHRRKEQ